VASCDGKINDISDGGRVDRDGTIDDLCEGVIRLPFLPNSGMTGVTHEQRSGRPVATKHQLLN
jgi:hypothetical protein